MIAVLTCLGAQHDLRIVLMATALCCVGSFAAMRLFIHAMQFHGMVRLSWSFLASVVGGAAAWCTHFVAMLAYVVNTSVAYDPILMAGSLLVAMGGVYLGFAVASLERPHAAPAIGGAIVGAALAAMHYLGMLAFGVEGVIRWRPGFVVDSVVLATGFSALAMAMARGQFGARFAKVAFAAVISAILSLHFTGMAALEVIPLAFSPPALGKGAEALAFATTLVGLLVIGAGALAYAIDERTRLEARQRLASLALIDGLTGLPNSTAFEMELEARLARRRPGDRLVVAAIGFNGFESIIERYGRKMGEETLQAIAHAMLGSPKPEVVIARASGSEFIALGPYGGDDDLGGCARRAVSELSKPLQIGSHSIALDARIGVATFPVDAVKPDELVRCAMLALGRAMSDPLEAVAYFNASMELATRRRQALTEDLRVALERKEFELYYQPQVWASNRRILGYEALLRWRHPEFGMVSPAEFIPIAEHTGLIVEIGDWALQTACHFAATRAAEWRVAVNLSPMQLRQANLPERVRDALASSGLSPKRLELELTESLLLDDRNRAIDVLGRIRALGVRLALDDFGAGYSSMDVLRHFPFDKIKLDKSFVDDVEANPQSLAILRAMLAMGRSLSIPVLAEGVETERQLAILRAEGCTKVQGYLTGRPAPPEDIVDAPLEVDMPLEHAAT